MPHIKCGDLKAIWIYSSNGIKRIKQLALKPHNSRKRDHNLITRKAFEKMLTEEEINVVLKDTGSQHFTKKEVQDLLDNGPSFLASSNLKFRIKGKL